MDILTPNELLEQAIKLEELGKIDEAKEVYYQTIKASPDWGTPYYNLGLIYKYELKWDESLKYNKWAAVKAPENEAAWWNLGIAATALGYWRTARECWNKVGLSYEVNDLPLEEDLGNTPVRLSPNESAEVVWCKRVDPARAVILNIPLPSSNHRFGDLVLNDGAPDGYRISNGKEYPVLNELQLLIKSGYKTYSVLLFNAEQTHVDKLEFLCEEAEIEMEDWTTIRLLCKQCSEGTPHEHHDKDLSKTNITERQIAFACTGNHHILEVLDKWRAITLVDSSDLLLELE